MGGAYHSSTRNGSMGDDPGVWPEGDMYGDGAHSDGPDSTMRGYRSVTDLAMDALRDITNLVQAEFHLARAELKQNIREALNGIVMLALSISVIVAGAVAFLVALGFGFSTWFGLSTWLGLGLASLIGLFVGIALLLSARKALDPETLAPTRTAENLQRDAELARKRI